jgi:hypothetical protein
MTFLNKKEDVIDIAVTPHGKYLISKGKFKPKFYAFFDDDIIYDGKYADLSEDQNDITSRIKESLSLRPTPVTSGSLNDDMAPITADSPITRKANFMLSNPLGTSDLRSDHYPAWQVEIQPTSQPISGTVEYKAPFRQRADMTEIPQINFEIQWTYFVPATGEEEDKDAAAYNVADEKILLSIEELNVFDKFNGNFEIEAFLLDQDGKQVRDLKFITDDAFDEQTGILMATTEEQIGSRYPRLDSSYVEYFLDVKVDEEIKDRVGREIGTNAGDLYAIRAGDEGDGEVCD